MSAPKAITAAVAAAPVPHPGALRAWLAAVRLPSLAVATSPVLVGAALTLHGGHAPDALTLALVLAAALLVQVVSNLQNDVGYTVRGAERGGTRTGLPRATAQGWLPVAQVRAAVAVLSVIAAALGLALAWRHGWPVLAMGVASLAAALAYMGGPRPIAYSPWGEAVVALFFGLVAVCGTVWLFAGAVDPAAVLAAAALGGLAAAALAVNNHRDRAHDMGVGRRTFAVCHGERASQRLFTALLLGPFALLPVLALAGAGAAGLAPLLLLPLALTLRRDFLRCPPGLAFNAILRRTFALELMFALVLATALVLQRALWA
jgi:1,4-dihydroxy-2-naphthoate octaprenyltransferase